MSNWLKYELDKILTIDTSFQIVHVSVSAGNLMTSASADSNIAVWDLEQKTYLCGFYAHDFVTDVIITKNRSKVVARVNEKHPSLLVLKLTGV